MESKKFSLLLDDVESSRTNFGKVEILSCYVAQRFTVDQITQLVESISRANSRLKVLKLVAEEMESCDLQNALRIIEVVSMSTTNKEVQLDCLEELLKYRKLNVSESESASLLVLFVETELHDKALRLLNKIRKPSIKHSVSTHNSSDPSSAQPSATSLYSSQIANNSASHDLATHPISQASNFVPSSVPYPFPPAIPPAYKNVSGVPVANPVNIGFTHPSNYLYPSASQPQQQAQAPPQSGKPPSIGFTV